MQKPSSAICEANTDVRVMHGRKKFVLSKSKLVLNAHFLVFQIFALTSLIFYVTSYAILNIFRRKETDDDEFLPTTWEDAIVYKVSLSY